MKEVVMKLSDDYYKKYEGIFEALQTPYQMHTKLQSLLGSAPKNGIVVIATMPKDKRERAIFPLVNAYVDTWNKKFGCDEHFEKTVDYIDGPINLQNLNFKGTVFKWVGEPRDVDFYRCDLTGTSFVGSVLPKPPSRVSFRDSILNGTDFTGVDTSAADFTNANIYGVIGLELTHAQRLNTICESPRRSEENQRVANESARQQRQNARCVIC